MILGKAQEKTVQKLQPRKEQPWSGSKTKAQIHLKSVYYTDHIICSLKKKNQRNYSCLESCNINKGIYVSIYGMWAWISIYAYAKVDSKRDAHTSQRWKEGRRSTKTIWLDFFFFFFPDSNLIYKGTLFPLVGNKMYESIRNLKLFEVGSESKQLPLGEWQMIISALR